MQLIKPMAFKMDEYVVITNDVTSERFSWIISRDYNQNFLASLRLLGCEI